MADAEARRRISHELSTSFVVEAAAGTGKTTALVSRIVALVRSGLASPASIVAVTFTDKAALELKRKVRAGLEELMEDAGASPDERGRAQSGLEELETASFSTFHSFCGDLLRERPVEAGVDPQFRVVHERGASYEEAFQRWFRAQRAQLSPGVRRFLRRTLTSRNNETRAKVLADAAWTVAERRDYDGPWERAPWDRGAAAAEVLECLRAAAALRGRRKNRDALERDLDSYAALVEAFEREPEDLDGWEARLVDAAPRPLRAASGPSRGKARAAAGETPFAQHAHGDVLAAHARAAELLAAFAVAANADLAVELKTDLDGFVAEYEAVKARAGELDLTDLLIKTRSMLISPDNAELRARLAARVTHLFVDEFQDTDPTQVDIVLMLVSSDPGESRPSKVKPAPGRLFLVGDPKQSIYRFRRADLDLYHATVERLLAAGAERLELTTSFRSLPELQTVVNATFARRFTGGHQARYVPLTPWRPSGRGGDGARDAVPPVIVLAVSERDAAPEHAEAVAQLLDELLVDRRTVNVDGLETPLEPHHVCLLFRRINNPDVTRPYLDALAARGIPSSLYASRALKGRPEVAAVLNALAAVEWPDDEYSVYATLRGPLVALEDGLLLAYRDTRGHFDPLRAAPLSAEATGPLDDVDDALRLLASLHRDRNRRPFAETVTRLYEALRVHAGLAVLGDGPAALAFAMRVVELARSYEAEGTLSFRAFVAALREEAQSSKGSEAAVHDEEGVRLISVHKAKGLEFPVVVLCDPDYTPGSYRAPAWVDGQTRTWVDTLCGLEPREVRAHREASMAREREEEDRLLYVAATRARDALVIPAGLGSTISGWLRPLEESLRAPERSDGSEGMPPAVWRAAPQRASGGVTSLRFHAALKEGPGAEAGRAEWAAFNAERYDLTERATRRERVVFTVTQLAEEPELVSGLVRADRAVTIDALGFQSASRGRRFGSLVHTLLSALDPQANDLTRHLAQLSRYYGRQLGATTLEESDAAAAAAAFLGHPWVREAFQSGAEREVPVVMALPEGLVEGVVDLVYRDASGLVVVDYKTDTALSEDARAAYGRQVALYAQAIERAHGDGTRVSARLLTL